MSDNVSAEEAEVRYDEVSLPETAEKEQLVVGEEAEAQPEPETIEYIEFVGSEPYGTEFTGEHTVSRRQLKDAWGVTTPKDLKWTKSEGGPNADRMLVPVSDMSEEAAKGFENDPMFKRVTL